jgi:hypothetical protein
VGFDNKVVHVLHTSRFPVKVSWECIVHIEKNYVWIDSGKRMQEVDRDSLIGLPNVASMHAEKLCETQRQARPRFPGVIAVLQASTDS